MLFNFRPVWFFRPHDFTDPDWDPWDSNSVFSKLRVILFSEVDWNQTWYFVVDLVDLLTQPDLRGLDHKNQVKNNHLGTQGHNPFLINHLSKVERKPRIVAGGTRLSSTIRNGHLHLVAMLFWRRSHTFHSETWLPVGRFFYLWDRKLVVN